MSLFFSPTNVVKVIKCKAFKTSVGAGDDSEGFVVVPLPAGSALSKITAAAAAAGG